VRCAAVFSAHLPAQPAEICVVVAMLLLRRELRLSAQLVSLDFGPFNDL
jgi:hypothetical protein